MILPLLILAAQLPIVPKRPIAPPGSGLELMAQCVVFEGMALGSGSANGEYVEKGALCLGYVEGYADGAKANVCLPPRPLMGIIHSYLAYMKDNPQYYDMPKAAGLQAAIDANFPCRK